MGTSAKLRDCGPYINIFLASVSYTSGLAFQGASPRWAVRALNSSRKVQTPGPEGPISDAFQGFAVFRLTPALGLSSHLPSSAHALTMLTMSYRQFETLTIEGSAESLLDSAVTKEMGQRRAFTMSKNNPAARRIDSLPK